MKKILRIAAITIGVILLLLILLPVLFKSKIETLVKQEINKQVEATVDWDRFSLTFFRGFPDLSVNLHKLSVTGHEPFTGDTLLALHRFEFRVSPFTALKKEVVVKSILLDRPLINGIVLANGTANWDIVPPGDSDVQEKGKTGPPESSGEEAEGAADAGPEAAEKTTEPESGADASGDADKSPEAATAMGVALERFAIQNGRLFFNDQSGDIAAAVEDLNLEVRGDFSMAQTDVQLNLAIHGINAAMGGVRYMKQGRFEMDVVAAADMEKSLYTLKKNEIRVNGLVLGAEGTVAMPADGSIVPDIRFFTRETSFRTLLSMVPAIYLSDFEALETSGSLALEGTVKGVMKDSLLPDATLKLAVKDGFFSYPDLPKDVSDVQIDLNVNYRGSDMDATTVDLDRFHLLLGGNPFDIAARVATPFSDMQVAGMVKGMIDFATLKDIVPLEELDLGGRLDADLSWDTRMSYIENEQFEQVDLDGRLMIEGVHVEAPDIPVPVQLQQMAMVFTPRYVNLESLDLLLGSSDLHVDGRLTNFIPYVFEGKTVAGTLNLSSSLLDANEFLAEEADDDAKKDDAGAGTVADDQAVAAGDQGTAEAGSPGDEEPSDSTAVPSPLKIPRNIDFGLTLDLKKLVYDNIVVENLSGMALVKDGVARLDGLRMEVLEGSVAVDGTVDTRGELTAADVALDLVGIDIPASYETFVTIRTLAPVARYCQGTANVEMDLRTMLDASMSPVYSSIDADGHLYARDLKVEQPATLEKLAGMLKNEKLRNLEVDRADIRFAVRDGRVRVEPFDLNFGDSKIRVSGSHGIDQTMDYLMDMQIAKSDMGGAANEMMNQVSALAAGAGFAVPQSDVVKVKANITGTFKDPKVRTNLSGNLTETKSAVKEAARERVTEEVEKVEKQVREEASEKAEALIREAEEQKAKLVAEAVAAGAKLVAEAEKKGAQLVKDAGSNPIKQIAAKKAAEELVKQAERQSDKLILEAEEQGDAIIERAKAEAGRI